jgi:hypothetical protein
LRLIVRRSSLLFESGPRFFWTKCAPWSSPVVPPRSKGAARPPDGRRQGPVDTWRQQLRLRKASVADSRVRLPGSAALKLLAAAPPPATPRRFASSRYSARAGLPARSATRLAREDFSVLYHRMPRLFTAWRSRAVTVAMPSFCARSPASISTCSIAGSPVWDCPSSQDYRVPWRSSVGQRQRRAGGNLAVHAAKRRLLTLGRLARFDDNWWKARRWRQPRDGCGFY